MHTIAFGELDLLMKSLGNEELSRKFEDLTHTLTDPKPSLVNTPEAYITTKPTVTKLEGITLSVLPWVYHSGKHIYDAIAALDSAGRSQRLGAVAMKGLHAGTRPVSSYRLMPKQIYALALTQPELAHSDLGKHIVYLRSQFPDDKEFGKVINKLTSNPAIDDILMHYSITPIMELMNKGDYTPEQKVQAVAFGHRYGINTLKMALAHGKGLDRFDVSDYVHRFMQHMNEDTNESREAVKRRNTFYNQNRDSIPDMGVQEELDTEPHALGKSLPLVKAGLKGKLKAAGIGAGLGALAMGSMYGRPPSSHEVSNFGSKMSGIGKKIGEGLDMESKPKAFRPNSIFNAIKQYEQYTTKPKHKEELVDLTPMKGMEYPIRNPKIMEGPVSGINPPRPTTQSPNTFTDTFKAPKPGGAVEWGTHPDATIYDLFAAAESGGRTNRIHSRISKGPHAGTRSVSSYGLMPLHVAYLARIHPALRDSELGKKINALSAHYGNDKVSLGRAINKLTNDQRTDDILMHHHIDYLGSQIKNRFPPGSEDYVKALGFAHNRGLGRLNQLLDEGGGVSHFTSPQHDVEGFMSDFVSHLKGGTPRLSNAVHNRNQAYKRSLPSASHSMNNKTHQVR